jgi:hypothetical protein
VEDESVKTCETCKHWDRDDSFPEEIYPEGFGKCGRQASWLVVECGHSEVSVSGRFGCILHEEKSA